MHISSYNCRGLPKDKRNLHLRPDILSVFQSSDIVCLQETWFSKQDLGKLPNILDNYHAVGVSTTDYSTSLIQGHPPGGVAIFWKSSFDTAIRTLSFGTNWCTGIELNIRNTKMYILNVYMPYQSPSNEEEYLDKLGELSAILDDLDSSCFAVVGDWNANLADGGSSQFAPFLNSFIQQNDLHCSTKEILPSNSYTHVSEAWGTTSWLDHIVTSNDFHATIQNIKIGYELSGDDHIPVTIDINVSNAPEVTTNTNNYSPRLNWSNITIAQKQAYFDRTDTLLAEINVPHTAILCNDTNCKNDNHHTELDNFYTNICDKLKIASGEIFKTKKTSHHNRPGWSEYVAELYNTSKNCLSAWIDAGKPRSGRIYDYYIRSRAKFKYGLRFIKRNEDAMRKESLAKGLLNKNSDEFWKEIKTMNNAKTVLPSSVDGVNGASNIADMWKNHYRNLFNCIDRSSNILDLYDMEASEDTPSVSVFEISHIIDNLQSNKSCGLDGIYAEHLMFASSRISTLLSLFTKSCLVHGYLPRSLLDIVLVPIIKDKSGSITSRDNYRPIALASILSKVIEKLLLQRIEDALFTSANQFGFKKKHSTDQCVYVLKELIDMYKCMQSSIFVCFLDASKAFDRVNHDKLFSKLKARGVPSYILRLLVFWYVNQEMCVRWGDSISSAFRVTNGVRQGGILSAYFFNVYCDDLSLLLNKCAVGCSLNNVVVNHLFYADDLALLSPSIKGLNRLLRQCEEYGIAHDIVYNAKKSVVMIFRARNLSNVHLPPFTLYGNVLKEVVSFRYLGCIISNDLSDDSDIERQRSKLYVQGNTILRKFHMCSIEVKVRLFKTFCASMYCAHLWWSFKKSSMSKLNIAYHSICKRFVGFSKYESSSMICTVFDIQSCQAIIRNLVYKFMCRVSKSSNSILCCLLSSSLLYSSRIRCSWMSSLYVNFEI